MDVVASTGQRIGRVKNGGPKAATRNRSLNAAPELSKTPLTELAVKRGERFSN